MRPRELIGWMAGVALVVSVTAVAAATPAQKCEASKNKAAGKYADCRHKAEAAFAMTPDLARLTVDLGRCGAKYDRIWPRLEAQAAAQGGACPSVGDQVPIRERIAHDSGVVATALAGGPLLTGFFGVPLETGQTTCWDPNAMTPAPCAGTGQDGEYEKGLSRIYVDHGDGTITDTRTTLMWEKMSDDGSIHDFDDRYGWGAAFTSKIATLNATSFAGHTDWRLPNPIEMQSLMEYGVGDQFTVPAVTPAFHTGCEPGCTVLTCSCSAFFYWTSTTMPNDRRYAYAGWFTQGLLLYQFKTNPHAVRAVRGGL
jgi:hypothetical protein